MEDQMALLILSFVFAMLDWFAVAAQRRSLEIIAKPLTMVFLIAWYLDKLPAGGTAMGICFLIGLILSLAGDVFLMLPAKFFVAGLLAFLMAHIAYILGFNITGLFFRPFALSYIVAILVVGIPIYGRLKRALIGAGNRSLVLPVTIYLVIISVMVLSAAITLIRPEWSFVSAVMATIGAVLFYASDAVLAWNRFVKSIRHGRLINMMMYHLAQYLIAFSVLSQLGKF
jgi:uncharacterized membrane protein YhhN